MHIVKIFGLKFYWKGILLGISITPAIHFIEKYLFRDWEFVAWLLIMVTLDTVTGFAAAWKEKNISNEGWGKVIRKVFVYSIFLIATNVLQHYTVGKEANGWFAWIDNAAFGTLIVREAISIFENLAIISPNMIPTWWLDRLKSVDNKVSELVSSKVEQTVTLDKQANTKTTEVNAVVTETIPGQQPEQKQ